MTHVPAAQTTQRLYCVDCFSTEIVDIDYVPEEYGWSEGRCPECAERYEESMRSEE